MHTELLGLERTVQDRSRKLGIRSIDLQAAFALLSPLREKSPITREHYTHSLRVGLKASAIAEYLGYDARALFFAGILHDVGKGLVPLSVLGHAGKWTARHQSTIRRHVMDGYRLLSGRFDFSADVMVWHHRFQPEGYPRRIPLLRHAYRDVPQERIREYGRILALADHYDALHRANSKFKLGGSLSGSEIRQKMLEHNPDRPELVGDLYECGIFAE